MVLRPDARDDLDQRALARPVITHKRGHLADRNVQVDAEQRADRTEVLANVDQSQQRLVALAGRGAASPGGGLGRGVACAPGGHRGAPPCVPGGQPASAHHEIPAALHAATKLPTHSCEVFTNWSAITVEAMLEVVTHLAVSSTDGTEVPDGRLNTSQH